MHLLKDQAETFCFAYSMESKCVCGCSYELAFKPPSYLILSLDQMSYLQSVYKYEAPLSDNTRVLLKAFISTTVEN